MTMHCTNNPGQSLSIDFQRAVSSEILITNLSNQTQISVEIEKDCTRKHVQLPSKGHYGVSLIVNNKVIDTQKITISQ